MIYNRGDQVTYDSDMGLYMCGWEDTESMFPVMFKMESKHIFRESLKKATYFTVAQHLYSIGGFTFFSNIFSCTFYSD